MSSKIAINRLSNANLYFEGNSLLGRAEEIQLPTIKVKTVEHKALGMIAPVEFFAGFEKLEGKIKWSSLYPDILTKTANPFRINQFQVRGSLESWNGVVGRDSQEPVVTMIRMMFKEFPLGTYKANDNVELETGFTATYIKLTASGKDLVEFDAMENIYKVDGRDMLADYRKNLGI